MATSEVHDACALLVPSGRLEIRGEIVRDFRCAARWSAWH
jgi:hypothetical protein